MSFKLQQANKAKAEAKIYKKQKRNERKTLSRLQCHRQNGDKGNAQAPVEQGEGERGCGRRNGSYIVSQSSSTLCTKYKTTTQTTTTTTSARAKMLQTDLCPCLGVSLILCPLDTAHPPIEPGTFALMLAHLHLTENTFNKRDLRNSYSSVKVRLGLLFASCSRRRNASASQHTLYRFEVVWF